jgi:hypothetical protein
LELLADIELAYQGRPIVITNRNEIDAPAEIVFSQEADTASVVIHDVINLYE